VILATYRNPVESGLAGADERIVLFICASGLKYPMPPAQDALDLNAAPEEWIAAMS